jgi:hypothetical protein
MQLANQTFYLAIFIVLVGLMARFLATKDDDRAQFKVLYWPVGLSFLALSMLAFFLVPWGGKIVLAAANILLIAGMINISLLFSFWNKSNTKTTFLIACFVFLATSFGYIHLQHFGSTIERIHLMNGVLGVLCIWQIISLAHLLKKDSAYQIKLLLGVVVFQLGTRIVRSIFLFADLNTNFQTLYQEDGWGFALRVASILAMVTICILITNYYLEKLWHDTAKALMPFKTGCSIA